MFPCFLDLMSVIWARCVETAWCSAVNQDNDFDSSVLRICCWKRHTCCCCCCCCSEVKHFQILGCTSYVSVFVFKRHRVQTVISFCLFAVTAPILQSYWLLLTLLTQSTSIKVPTAATLNICWNSDWKTRKLHLTLWPKFMELKELTVHSHWLVKHKLRSLSMFCTLAPFLCQFVQFLTTETIHQHDANVISKGRHRNWLNICKLWG